MRVIWNTSHHEFTVFDYYYFSSLELFLKQNTILVENKSPLDEVRLNSGDILVINYPEVEFTSEEKKAVKSFVESGGRLIVTAYYQNEDYVASICSELLEFANIRFHEDGVFTSEEGFLTTASVTDEAIRALDDINFKRVYFPCSCTLTSDNAIRLLEVDGKCVALAKKIGDGRIFALGTAVFWDNFAIDREQNWDFVKWLFK